ncbi:MAG: hypothetical protein QXY15_10015 [Candidatus Nitrosotenuis sp.]
MYEKPKIRNLIKEELAKIRAHKTELHQGCAACHVMFSLKEKLGIPEQDCADLVSELLSDDTLLNEEFVETVEQIHMIERSLGGSFALRERQSKDAYLDVYFANVLEELSSDLNHFSHQVLLRKLLLAYLSLYIAQTIGVDYHAATEELYYLLRKNNSKNIQIDEFILKIETKIKQNHF